MKKFVMTELGNDQQVVLDVPVGDIMLKPQLMRDGTGEMVFAIRTEDGFVDAVRIICQTSTKALVMAKAFVELAEHIGDDEEGDD